MSSFEVTRATSVDAAPAVVHGLVDDFHQWQRWSPWEGIDPDMERTYGGADAGVGARYAWKGNRKAGAGNMEIIESTPHEVVAALEFTKPFRAQNTMAFELTPAGDGTDVTWRLTGEQKGLMAIVGKVMTMDKLVGKDFEKGLAQLKLEAERG